MTVPWENDDPYYDLIDDYDLILSSFMSEYGIRLSRELKTMKWDEFKDLLVGLSPESALGRIVAIRSEQDREVIKNFTKEQRRIRNEWLRRNSKKVSEEQLAEVLEKLKDTFIHMAGDGKTD